MNGFNAVETMVEADIAENAVLRGIDGFISVNEADFISIFDNPLLHRYCGLYNLFNVDTDVELDASGNDYDISIAEIVSGGSCRTFGIVQNTYNTLAEAITAASANQTIETLKNYMQPTNITLPASIIWKHFALF